MSMIEDIWTKEVDGFAVIALILGIVMLGPMFFFVLAFFIGLLA